MAVLDAVRKIKNRMITFAAEKWSVVPEDIHFRPDGVHVGAEVMTFQQLAWQAYFARVSLSSNGFYKTPKISWNPETGCGRPFFYFAYGAACAEVSVDLLTGSTALTAWISCMMPGSPQSGYRYRADRGRVRARRGLADDGGTCLGSSRTSADPCAQHLQDPGLF